MSLLIWGMVSVVTTPTGWSDARVLKVCDGLPIVQREDGTIWLRDRWRAYRVDDPDKIC